MILHSIQNLFEDNMTLLNVEEAASLLMVGKTVYMSFKSRQN